MQDWQKERKNKLADLQIGAHVIAYLLVDAVFVSSFVGYYSSQTWTLFIGAFFIPGVIFIVLDYLFMQQDSSKGYLQGWNIAKNSGLLLLVTFVFFTNADKDFGLYGALFMLPVVLSCISLGQTWGIVFAGAATASIQSFSWLHLTSTSGHGFEATLFLSGIMFLIAWFIGGIFDLERKTSADLTVLAHTDGLTGLANHRHFQERLEVEVTRSLRQEEPLSLLMVDIDYFKRYNDTYGHTQGDLVLKEIASLLADHSPPEGFLARYGGEEFVVLLPQTGLEEALATGHKLRNAVATHTFSGESAQPYDKITVSVGVANLPYHAAHKLELINAVDEALYSSKFTGRNRVRTYLAVLERLSQSSSESDRELITSLRTLMTLVNAKDRYTFGHSERVAHYSKLTGQQLGLTASELRLLEFGAFLHDIGKLEVPRDVLNKNGPLLSDEWQLLKQHPILGAEILKRVQSLQPVITAVLYHHENFDGSGYPEGLKGKDIPLFARILRAVDSFDAITTSRPYRTPLSKEEAIDEINRCRGALYDPLVADAFLDTIRSNPQYEADVIS